MITTILCVMSYSNYYLVVFVHRSCMQLPVHPVPESFIHDIEQLLPLYEMFLLSLAKLLRGVS